MSLHPLLSYYTNQTSFVSLTGGQYDIVSWDVRGTVDTIPFKCSDDPAEQFATYKSQVSGNSSESAVGTLWARGTIDAETCHADSYANVVGSVMTTAFTARDMLQIVDALEEDGLLRYWGQFPIQLNDGCKVLTAWGHLVGFSYGTVLGATVTSMFPERMDKVVLDGVQNPHEYYHSPVYVFSQVPIHQIAWPLTHPSLKRNLEEWTQSDAAFSDIFKQCINAGPKLCPLAAHNKTASALESTAWSLLETVKTNPIPIGPILLDYTGLKGLFLQSLYSIQLWPIFTSLLNTLAFGIGDPSSLVETLQSGVEFLSTDPASRDSTIATYASLTGIYCGDNQVRISSLDDFLPSIGEIYNMSRVAGDGAVGSHMRCMQWKIKPKETYTGSFGARTKTPFLFVGNTLDGHTPLTSAYNVSSGYEGSVVLEVGGNGHCSTSVPSRCALESISAYWVNGTMPEPKTVCKGDAKPFTGAWWPNVFKEAGVDKALLFS